MHASEDCTVAKAGEEISTRPFQVSKKCHRPRSYNNDVYSLLPAADGKDLLSVVSKAGQSATTASVPHDQADSINRIPGLVKQYMDGQLEVDSFVTHTETLAGINRGFKAMKAGDCSMSSCMPNERLTDLPFQSDACWI